MPHLTPYPRCIFCGDKANSREHAIPKWIGKRLGIKDLELRPTYAFNVDVGHQPVRFGSYRHRIFCKGCNEHFKHLEDEVIPILEPMARGEQLSVGAAAQDVLARWGAKTGYALIAAEPTMRDLVPEEHRRILRTANVVHDLTWVGYISWRGHAHAHWGDHGVIDRSNELAPERTIRAYQAMLMFGHVALKVFGFYEPVPRHRIHFDTGSLKQISPRLDRDIAWPLWPPAGDSNVPTMMGLVPLTPES